MKKSIVLLLVIMMLALCTMPAFASTAITPQTSDELLLCDFWITKNSEVHPFGENRKPDDVFIADIDNDNAPELVVYYSYLGPGGPAFAIYKAIDGVVEFYGAVATDSGSGINSEVCIAMEDNGDIKLIEHCSSYNSDKLGMLSIHVASFTHDALINESYAEVQYIDTVSYTTDITGAERVYCSKDEADAFFAMAFANLHQNIVFSSESEQKQSNDFFGIWAKQSEKRNVISVLVDGKKIEFDQNPVVADDCTLVPLRAISEELGAAVIWDAPTRTAVAIKGDVAISVTEGRKAFVKNAEVIGLDVAPRIIGSRTLVPVKVISETFGCKIDWDDETKSLLITTK